MDEPTPPAVAPPATQPKVTSGPRRPAWNTVEFVGALLVVLPLTVALGMMTEGVAFIPAGLVVLVAGLLRGAVAGSWTLLLGSLCSYGVGFMALMAICGGGIK